MNSTLKNILQVLAIILGLVAAYFLFTWLFQVAPTLAWVVFAGALVIIGGTITGIFPAIYRKIKGIK